MTVRLFASLREAAGADRVSVSVPAGTPVGAVWGHLPDAGPRRRPARRRALRAQPRVDPARGDAARRRRGGGGAAGVGRMIDLTRRAPRPGGADGGRGRPRPRRHGRLHRHHPPRGRADARWSELHYEAYEELALSEMAAVAAEAARALRRPGGGGAPRGRAWPSGEPSVAVAASAGHRPAAFAACRYVIDELKRRAPIWKQTVYADGEASWIDGCAAPPCRPGRADARGAPSGRRRRRRRSSPRAQPDLEEELGARGGALDRRLGRGLQRLALRPHRPLALSGRGLRASWRTSSPPPT